MAATIEAATVARLCLVCKYITIITFAFGRRDYATAVIFCDASWKQRRLEENLDPIAARCNRVSNIRSGVLIPDLRFINVI
jgi:hypothetical protein